jgi:hypothetical protein
MRRTVLLYVRRIAVPDDDDDDDDDDDHHQADRQGALRTSL